MRHILCISFIPQISECLAFGGLSQGLDKVSEALIARYEEIVSSLKEKHTELSKRHLQDFDWNLRVFFSSLVSFTFYYESFCWLIIEIVIMTLKNLFPKYFFPRFSL